MSTSTHPSLPSPVVARLIPQNTHTRQALEDLQASDAVLDHYKAYVRCQAPPDRDPATPQPGKSDSLKDLVAENGESTEDESFSPPSFDGRYGCIELDFGRVSQKLPGWRLGGGGSKTSNTNPKVDVLVVQYEQRRNMGVARFHALIHFHKESGVLMLTAVSERFPVIYFLDNEPLQLSSGESHVLFQRSNRFQLGKLEFLLRYEDMDAARYATWVSARNALLATHNLLAPCKDIMALPWRHNFDRLWDFILHETVGTGAFGWVKASVHRRTGHPYAVKQLDLKHSSERRACNEEVEISAQLQSFPGLLVLHDAFCDHGHRQSCRTQERFYLVYSLASHGDLSKQDWSTSNDLSQIESLLRGPLQGIEALHSRGFIHRDITRKNVLVQSLTPPDAVVADFGKTIQAPSSTDTKIGPIYTLAPEVNGGRYDGKTDIWSFGLACFHTIFLPSVFERVQSLEQHTALLNTITEYASRGQHHALLAHLLKQLLAWNAHQRPSATQALTHPFFALCTAQHEPVPPHHAGSNHDADRPSKIAKSTPQKQEVSPPASPARQGAENASTKRQRGSSFARSSQLSPTQENTPL